MTHLSLLALALVLAVPPAVDAQSCTEPLAALVVAPTVIAADLPDRSAVASYEVAVFTDGVPVTGIPVATATIPSAAWTVAGASCYTTPIPAALLRATHGHYRGAIRAVQAGAPDWSDLSNLFAYVADQVAPPPPSPPVAGCAACATSVTFQGHVYTLGDAHGLNFDIKRDGALFGGQGVAFLVLPDNFWTHTNVDVWYHLTNGELPWVFGPKPAMPVPPPPPPPVVVQVLKHFRIVVDGSTYDGDLPKVP